MNKKTVGMKQINKILNNSELRMDLLEKIVWLSFDGDQFVVRIPQKISVALNLKKGNKVKFSLNLPYIEENHKKIMVVEIIE